MSYLLPLMCIGQMAMIMPAALAPVEPIINLEFGLGVDNFHPSTKCNIKTAAVRPIRYPSGFT